MANDIITRISSGAPIIGKISGLSTEAALLAVQELTARTAAAETDIDALQADKADSADVYPKSEVYTKTEVDTKDATKADKLMATNLVSNGDFSQGTTGWTLNGSSSNVVTNNILRQTFNGTEWTPGISIPFTIFANRKYYVSYFFDSNDVTNNKIVRFGTSPYLTIYDGAARPLRKSVVVAPLSNFSTFNMFVNGYTHHKPLNTEYGEYGWVIIIDLTTLFGVGNEPSKETMDRLLAEFPNSWFDGTKELMNLKTLPELLGEKANKAQEAWITPTLLNGATGNPQYRKNQFGRVEFKGKVTCTQGSPFMLLAIGYKPTTAITTLSAVVSGETNIARRVLIMDNGNVYVNVPYGTYEVCLDGISFNL